MSFLSLLLILSPIHTFTFISRPLSLPTSLNAPLPATTTSLNMETIKCDVCIVGGGPAGCTTALYTSRSALRTVIVDKNPDIGALAVTGLIANYPGVKGDGSGKELLDMMRGQAEEYGADYVKAQVFMIGVDDDEEDEDGGVPRR
jgi:NADPH-dependent 2,4-dienoyl-CoA reductase/sulfur reductase-like enzyme